MPSQPQRPPVTEAGYPASYRDREVSAVVRALQGNYSLLLCGPGGSGKSHLLRFLAFHSALPARLGNDVLRLYLDCNAAIEADAAGVFRGLLVEAGASEPLPREATSALVALRASLATSAPAPAKLVVLLDRFERIPVAVQPAVLDGLRHVRDYLGRRVSYILGARTPPPIAELSQEFDDLLAAPATLWLGPLASADASWVVEAALAERGQQAPPQVVAALLAASGRYPRLLRAAALAWAEQPWPPEADPAARLLEHPQVQRICESLWRECDESAQQLLERLAAGASVAVAAEHPLRRSGFAQETAKGQLRLGIPLLARFIAARTASPRLALTGLEERLWALLQAHPNTLVRREVLVAELYGDNPDGVNDEALTALVARLRRKLLQANQGTIEAIWRQGYRFQPGADTATGP